jgi:O-antigen/teichoic acid export membrane protein
MSVTGSTEHARAAVDEAHAGGDAATSGTRRIVGARIVSLVVVFLGSVILARSLGPDGRGAHAFFVAATVLLATALGVGSGMGAYVLASHGKVSARLLAASSLWMAAATGLFAVLVLVVLHALTGLLPTALAGTAGWPLLAGVAVSGLAANLYQVKLAFASGRAMAGAVLSFGPYTLAAVGYVLLMVTGTANLGAALWAFAVAPWVLAGLAAIVRPPLSIAVLGRPRPRLMGQTIREGLRSYPGQLASILHARADVILLGVLAPASSVGIYVVAYQTVEPLLVLASASGATILALGPGGAVEGRNGVTARLIRETLVTGGLLAMVAAAIAPIAVPLVYGAEFSGAVIPLLILLPGIIALSIGRIASADLMRRNHLGQMASVSIVAVVINISLNLLLIPHLGPAGAAVASLVSYAAHACLAVFLDQRAGGLHAADLVPRVADVRAVLVGWSPRTLRRRTAGPRA